MIIIKFILSAGIVYICTYLGIYKAKSYEKRENELKKIKSSLDFFKSKIEFTSEPIKEIFLQISKVVYENKNNIFLRAGYYIDDQSAGEAWNKAIEEENKGILEEDKEVLKMLRKTTWKNR